MQRLLGSVRWRITVATAAVAAVALALGAAALVVVLDRSLSAADDDVALARVRSLTAEISQGTLPGVLTDVGGEGVAQVVAGDGRVVAASPNIVGRGPLVAPGRSRAEPVTRVLRGAPDDAETEDYRVWVLDLPADDRTVVVGSSLESVGEATRALRRELALAVPVLVLLVAGATWLAVGRSLVRLEEASRRQDEFVADASHELQSPLAALRTRLEVARRDPAADWPVVADDLLADTARMESLVSDLLELARESRPTSPPTRSLLDLDDVVLEEAARVRADGGPRVDATGVSAAPVLGDPTSLRRLVRNLLENAARHARGVVALSLTTESQGEVLLVVADDGPGIGAEERERVFDRFVTSDPVRGPAAGSGLGLAIARAVARRHGGSLVAVDPGPGGGARLELRLPGGADAAEWTSPGAGQ
ncbi:MAG: HAMP domain-containing sensor histidine kinase [Nocardioidaceae bacterium]